MPYSLGSTARTLGILLGLCFTSAAWAAAPDASGGEGSARKSGDKPASVEAASVGSDSMEAAPAGTSPTDAARAEEAARKRALRRTPTVELFERWKPSVVFVTGPIINSAKPTTEEFFLPSKAIRQDKSVGTGFVIHPSGYIVTNAHAAERLITPIVVLSTGKHFLAEPVAIIHDRDLALLKIDEAGPLKPVSLGAADDAMIGETVVVIGNPYGMLHTCTTGILSAMRRATHLADVPNVTLRDLLQSDAGINPGSSGGPWFNIAGDVIGMTTSMKRDAENIAFAISAATIRRTVPGMLDIERRQGITTGLTLADNASVRIQTVASGGPAERLGLRPGDTITNVAGVPVSDAMEFHLALVDRKAGDRFPIEILRDGKQQHGSLVLDARPKPDVARLLRQRFGMTAVPLEPEKAKAMMLRVPRGVLVTEVDAGMYAGRPVLPKPGDVLARFGRIRPRDPDHLGLLLEKINPGDVVPLVLLRQEGQMVMRIDMNVTVPR